MLNTMQALGFFVGFVFLGIFVIFGAVFLRPFKCNRGKIICLTMLYVTESLGIRKRGEATRRCYKKMGVSLFIWNV